MRLFIAVQLPAEVQAKIAEIREDLSRAAQREKADIKWVQPEQFHFTLKFLGECPDEQLPGITEALKTAVEGVAPFSLRLGSLGAFPEKGSLRVIWVGLLEGDPPLRALAERVEAACELLGFPQEERLFHAHVTLGRGRGSKNMAKMRAHIEAKKIEPMGPLAVHSITLVRSTLSPKGPMYTDLQEFELPTSPPRSPRRPGPSPDRRGKA